MQGRSRDDADISHSYRREIGRFIRHVREERGLTQRELGALIGVGNTAISNAELGQSSLAPDLFAPLAKALDIERQFFGQLLLRYTNPWLYALIFGEETVPTLPTIPRRRRGPPDASDEARRESL